MNSITKKAFAKLNFNLHVLPELLPNGYHQLKLLNFESDLADTLTLIEIPKGIILTCDNPNLAVDETNLAYKAAKLVIEMFHIGGGIKININKQIPITGGLGGGSADGAAVILGLDKLWKLNLSQQQKIELADKLGKEVPYLTIGGVCLVSGAGEIVEPLNFSFPDINLVIISPIRQKPSTGWSFSQLNLNRVGQHLGKLDKLIEAIKNKDLYGVAQNLHNDFEESLSKYFPEIIEIKNKMLKNGALGANLCGAGLSIFGIFDTEKSAKIAFLKLKKEYPQTFFTKTI